MTKDETLKMALDFLMTRRMGAEAVIEALNEALAQPVQEPVAWMCDPFGDDEVEYGPHQECENCVPLYTAPPQREWVGLTVTTILNMMPSTIPAKYDGELMEFARAVETKLKENT